MPGQTPQPGEQHPEQWRRDLSSNAMAGQNLGTAGPHREKDGPTAYDIKDLHERLPDFTDDQLKQIVLVPQGARLEQGATYIDLQDAQRRQFTATGDMEAGPGNWYVPKSEIDYELWNHLIGVQDPRRTGTAG